MTPSIKNILFDLDGTLIDSQEGITGSIQFALQTLGVTPPSSEELRWCIGPPLRDSFPKLLNTIDLNKIEQALALYRSRYFEIGLYNNKIYDGVESMLKKLKTAQYRLFVATSKMEVFMTEILDFLKLSDYFDAMYGATIDGARKSKTEILEYLLAEQKLELTQTVMVGDREYDIKAAQENNIRSIGVTYGYGTLKELKEANPNSICKTPLEIAETVTN